MKRILLIMPSLKPNRTKPDFIINKEKEIIDGTEPFMPLNIISLAAYLENNSNKISIIDTRLYDKISAFEKIKKVLANIDIVGISVMSGSINDALNISEMIKVSTDYKMKIIWGGVHPTLFPEQTISSSYVDYVVVGEGEKPLLELLNNLDENGELLKEDIKNVCWKRNGKIILDRKYEFINIEELPIPAYHLLDIEKYVTMKLYNGKWVRKIELQTSRGCPNRCSFCINTIASKFRWRFQTSTKVIGDVKKVIERYNINHIFFIDENFFPNKNRIAEIVNKLEDLNITWEADCRADYFHENYLNDEFCEKLRDSGCVMLRIGIESGSQRILEFLKKDITVEDILRAVNSCRKSGIQPMFSYMIGIPTEKNTEMLDTLELISELEHISPDMVHSGPQVFRPYPGGELYEHCLKFNQIEQPKTLKEWKSFDLYSASDFSRFKWIEDIEFVNFIVWFMYQVKSYNSKIKKLNIENFVRYFLSKLAYGIYYSKKFDKLWILKIIYKIIRYIKR